MQHSQVTDGTSLEQACLTSFVSACNCKSVCNSQLLSPGFHNL